MVRRHTQLQRKAAGPRGKTEVPLKVRGKKTRLDAETSKKAIEIERSSNAERIAWALQKLASSGKPIKILKVRYLCVDKADEIRKQLRLRRIEITNLTAKDR
jgi:threonine synthase